MSRQPQSFLGVTKSVGYTDHPAHLVEFDNAIYAGLKWRVISPALVPPFEELPARRPVGYQLHAWYYALDHMERAFEVALFREEQAIKGHQADAEARSLKADMQRKPK